MSKEYETRITRLTVAPKDEQVFSEMATHIEIDDEAAGEFVKITQQLDCSEAKSQQILVGPEEWGEIKSAVDILMTLLKED